ncbi:FtsX-like permease family protein [Paenibacillus sp. GSMTC-2017]|uniref:ABC transporter permease n=1 Tax=Paenibacillus sp. GSMTC-2017 TaxID=2794350 RepID=UPI0018DA14F9|nr:ABC transporter permease [Paenibacillus sp. GSMTC-2017]MBH5317401.1 FtsX-like permease family protein [Paenibacillus sp. GSMTC-2017]
MALFVMIVRKMLQNKWLVFSMFIGILITVALVSSMPIYSEAILSRMLKKELEQLQTDKGNHPGASYYNVYLRPNTHKQINSHFNSIDNMIKTEGVPGFQLPVNELVTDISSLAMDMKLERDPNPISRSNKHEIVIKALDKLEKHIKLKDGRMPAAEPVDNVYEVLVTQSALNHFKTVLDTVFIVEDNDVFTTIKLKPVGIIEKAADDDPFFRYGNLADLNKSFILPFETAKKHMLKEEKIPIAGAGWFIVLDYSKIEFRHIVPFVDNFESIQSFLRGKFSRYQIGAGANALETMSTYMNKAANLKTLMWALNVPVLIMLAFYMFMVSNLIAGRQKNEIAVLRSRGAARWQIICSYFIENALLCGIAFALGPIMGALLTRILGASSGFMEFVQRVSLPVRITDTAYNYGLIAAGCCLLIVLIPIVIATRVSIVDHKQQMARLVKTPIWHKLFLDVIALGLSIYGLFTFRKWLTDLQKLGLETTDLKIDPLQFIVPALFIMGLGLLLLRFYPWLLRLIYWIGRKWWPPSLYATLIQVGRSSSQYQFLMIFLIMTIATGVFSASAARTINENTKDKIRYENGADLALTVSWISDAPPPPIIGRQPAPPPSVPKAINYLEPSYDSFLALPGVEHGAKVFTKEEASIVVHDQGGQATLIGIDTDDFGNTAWFRDKLLNYHINDYLNLIATDSTAVLISKTLAEQKNAKEGDTIYIGWEGVSPQPFIVYGIIDYFPTFNPNLQPNADTKVGLGSNTNPMLVVGHLGRVQSMLKLEPYEVWLKIDPKTPITDVYTAIQENKLPVTKIKNTREDLIKAQNDPYILAINGLLTLGFVVSIIVSFIGFLLYWVLSLRGRTLQNGILRAIGLSLKNLITMLALEQLLTSGVAVMFGIIVGNVASLLFVPNFQIAFNPSSLVPPFMVRIESSDIMQIYVMVGIMLMVGLGILAFMLSRLRIHQALKLGED